MAARSRVLRVGGMLAGLVALPLVPGLAFTVMGLQGASTVWTLGPITGLLAVLAVGLRTALGVAVATSVLTVAAVAASGTPWAAALVMLVAAGATGLTSVRGLSGSLVMAPITVAYVLADPPAVLPDRPPLEGAVVTGGAMLLAIVWGAALARAAGSRVHLPTATPVPPRVAVGYAVVLGLALGAAAAVASALTLRHGGAWLMLTLLVVLQPHLDDAWSRVLQRVAGTLAGFGIALVLGLTVPWPGVAYVVGGACLVGALSLRVIHRPYWQYVTLLTPAVVLMDGAGTSVVATDVTRLTFTLIGAGSALVVMAVLLPLRARLNAPSPPDPPAPTKIPASHQ